MLPALIAFSITAFSHSNFATVPVYFGCLIYEAFISLYNERVAHECELTKRYLIAGATITILGVTLIVGIVFLRRQDPQTDAFAPRTAAQMQRESNQAQSDLSKAWLLAKKNPMNHVAKATAEQAQVVSQALQRATAEIEKAEAKAAKFSNAKSSPLAANYRSKAGSSKN